MRRAAAIALFALAALTLSVVGRGSAASGAAGEAPAVPQFVPELGLPATEVVAFGASPAEASGEAWAYGYLGRRPAGRGTWTGRPLHPARARYRRIWQRIPLPVGPAAKRRSDRTASRRSWEPWPVRAPRRGASPPDRSRHRAAGPGGSAAPGAAATGPGLLGEGESLPPQAPPEGAPTPYAVYDPTARQGRPPDRSLRRRPHAGRSAGGGRARGTRLRRRRMDPRARRSRGEPVRPLAISCGPTRPRLAPTRAKTAGCWRRSGRTPAVWPCSVADRRRPAKEAKNPRCALDAGERRRRSARGGADAPGGGGTGRRLACGPARQRADA